jgi:hypothetical protein
MKRNLLACMTFTLISGIAALALTACGSSARARGGVIIEPLDTATPVSAAASALAVPAQTTRVPKVPGTGAQPAAASTQPTVAPTLAAQPSGDPTEESLRPASGRWIEVDVTHFVVRLMDGQHVVETIGPVAVGAQVDTGAYESTQTGLFHVYNKLPDLAYDAPYKTYISDWVGFDPAKDNGFHSFLKDKDGTVVDPDTGRVSNGCIRTPDPTAISAFAEVGMPVWVHA